MTDLLKEITVVVKKAELRFANGLLSVGLRAIMVTALILSGRICLHAQPQAAFSEEHDHEEVERLNQKSLDRAQAREDASIFQAGPSTLSGEIEDPRTERLNQLSLNRALAREDASSFPVTPPRPYSTPRRKVTQRTPVEFPPPPLPPFDTAPVTESPSPPG